MNENNIGKVVGIDIGTAFFKMAIPA